LPATVQLTGNVPQPINFSQQVVIIDFDCLASNLKELDETADYVYNSRVLLEDDREHDCFVPSLTDQCAYQSSSLAK
jgi:hypothetical protein